MHNLIDEVDDETMRKIWDGFGTNFNVNDKIKYLQNKDFIFQDKWEWEKESALVNLVYLALDLQNLIVKYGLILSIFIYFKTSIRE